MTVLLLFRRTLIPLAALAIAAAAARAAETEGAWTVTPALASQYVFRGVRLAGPSLQSAVDYTAKEFNCGVWATGALQSESRGTGRDEVDLYGVWSRTVFTDTLELAPGLTVYGFPSAARSAGEYPLRIEPCVGLNALWRGVRLTPKLYYDFMREGPTAELSAAAALPLARWGTEVDLFASMGAFCAQDAEAGPVKVKNSGRYWLASVSVPYQVGQNSRLALALGYAEGVHNLIKRGAAPEVRNPDAAGRWSVTLSCSIGL